MSTRSYSYTRCDLCGEEAVESAVRFLADVDVCKACAERPIIDLAPLFGTVRRLTPLSLSRREGEVLTLLADGLSGPQIAARLYLSESSVKTYLARIYTKLGAKNRTQAMIAAVRGGMI